MKHGITLIFALLLLFTSITANATLYKSVDADGNVTYSQSPPKTGNYKTIKVKKFKPVPANASQKSLAAKKLFEDGAKVREENELVKSELKKNRGIQKKNCDSAKQNLRLFTIYKKLKNDKGEYYRVTDTERARRIKTAKGNIKEFCN